MRDRLFAFFACLVSTTLPLSTGCLPRTDGELDNGGFTYFCASDDDLACTNDLFNASGIPNAIAVGAHFDLKFNPDGVESSASLKSASNSILSTDLGLDPDTTGFRFSSAGTAAVLAQDGGEIIDFIHLTGAVLDRITITDRVGDQVTQMTLGKSSFDDTLSATPRDNLGNTLAGALKYTWKSSDTDVVTVDQDSLINRVFLSAGSPGKATVSVTINGETASVDVTVGGAP